MDYFGNESQSYNQLRKVKIVRNGNPDKLFNLTLKHNITYSELCDDISDLMGIQKNLYEQFRIFRKSGVELEQQEVEYIKDHEILYVSRGEDFDEVSHFAEYKLLGELGQGGFGTVYEAKHRITKEKVAIKIAESNKSQNAKDVTQMFKEISALKNLKHKNILKILNAFTQRKEMKVILVLEYLEGGDLKKYVKENGRLCEEECQYFFKQLYAAISYCHREKIIHRDLKLENIMLADRHTKQIKVVDFGISGMSSNFNIDFTEAGSIRYLAPEVIQYKAPANSAIDIWAMGIILYQMLHGYPPFDGNNKQIILDKIIKGEYEIGEDIRLSSSKAVIDLIKRTITQDPKERISIFEMGNHDWILKGVEQILKEEQEEIEELNQKKNQLLIDNFKIVSSEKLEEQQNQDKLKQNKPKKSFAAPTQSFLNRFSTGNERQDQNQNSDVQTQRIKYKRLSTLDNSPKYNEVSDFTSSIKQTKQPKQ